MSFSEEPHLITSSPQLRVQSCAAVTASTPGDGVSATVAGRAQSVMFLPPSASILNAGGMAFV